MMVPRDVLGLVIFFPPVNKHAQTSCPTWSLFVAAAQVSLSGLVAQWVNQHMASSACCSESIIILSASVSQRVHLSLALFMLPVFTGQRKWTWQLVSWSCLPTGSVKRVYGTSTEQPLQYVNEMKRWCLQGCDITEGEVNIIYLLRIK